MIAWQFFGSSTQLGNRYVFDCGFVLVDFSEDDEREVFMFLDVLVLILLDFILLM